MPVIGNGGGGGKPAGKLGTEAGGKGGKPAGGVGKFGGKGEGSETTGRGSFLDVSRSRLEELPILPRYTLGATSMSRRRFISVGVFFDSMSVTILEMDTLYFDSIPLLTDSSWFFWASLR